MLKLEIYEDVQDQGEYRWHLRLLDADGSAFFHSVDPLPKGAALAFAKKIKNDGIDAALFNEASAGNDDKIWLKWDKGKDFEELLKQINEEINKADIVWNPPDADPAYPDKITDQTETMGIPGS